MLEQPDLFTTALLDWLDTLSAPTAPAISQQPANHPQQALHRSKTPQPHHTEGTDPWKPPSPPTTILVDWLINRVASYLNTDPDAIETDTAIGDYGLDSVFALNLCTDLEFEFGILAEPTIAWDYPTIDDIAGHLTEELRTGQ